MTRTEYATRQPPLPQGVGDLVGLAVVISSRVEQARPAQAAFPGDNGQDRVSTTHHGRWRRNPDGDFEIFT